MAFLEEIALMPPMQSAYRAGHSTETATLKVLYDILDAVDSQECAGPVGYETPLISSYAYIHQLQCC